MTRELPNAPLLASPPALIVRLSSPHPLRAGTVFGPYAGLRTTNSTLATLGGRAWRIGDGLWMDAQNPYFANWLVKVNSYAGSGKEKNLDCESLGDGD